MYRALHTGRTGMKAYQDKLDIISNNLANTQTDGYKKIDTDFISLLKDSIKGQGLDSAGNPMETIPLGTGVRTEGTHRILDQGILLEDGNPLALALDGEGFFGLENENGDLLLTRTEYFAISSEGELVSEDGLLVNLQDSKSLESFTPSQIEITAAGEMIATGDDGERKSVGKLNLYKVSSPEALTDAGNGRFLPVESDVEQVVFGEAGETTVRQGFVEKSNVDIGQEMVDMMVSQRAYQMNAKAIQSTDEMWSLINNIKR